MRGPQQRETGQPASSTAVGPATLTRDERRQKSPETSAAHKEECTNHLPQCPAANLAFYQEQLELAKQAVDLANSVYEEAKEDDDLEV